MKKVKYVVKTEEENRSTKASQIIYILSELSFIPLFLFFLAHLD